VDWRCRFYCLCEARQRFIERNGYESRKVIAKALDATDHVRHYPRIERSRTRSPWLIHTIPHNPSNRPDPLASAFHLPQIVKPHNAKLRIIRRCPTVIREKVVFHISLLFSQTRSPLSIGVGGRKAGLTDR